MNIDLRNGNCLDVLKTIPSNSIDAVVTDPPYEIGFMGKSWDSTGIAYNKEMWGECLRVLKPGGHLLSFSATRTYHRMACAIEDAGFEIRDMIEWIYGSGFPKSLNIGKAVDKLQGNERQNLGITQGVASNNTESMNSGTNKTSEFKQEYELTKGTSEWEGWGTALKPAHENIVVAQKSFQSSSDFDILFVSLLNKLKKELCQYQSFAKIAIQNLKLNHQEQKEEVNIAQWLVKKHINTQEDLSEVMGMLQLVSTENTNWNIVLLWLNILQDLYKAKNTYITLTELNMITELKILNSLEWESTFQNIIQVKSNKTDGLNVNVYSVEVILKGVQLKLNDILTRFAQENVILKESKINFALNREPICMARKPLSEKTVAENCLKWGTGGINIDESRVDFSDNEPDKRIGTDALANGINTGSVKMFADPKGKDIKMFKEGRWPANLIHDGSEEVMACFPESKSTGGTGKIGLDSEVNLGGGNNYYNFGDSGNASRFFKSIIYQAKASKSERNKGCENLKAIQVYGDDGGTYKGLSDSKLPSQNDHPTVKPIALMAYLIKMVTKENATVLDPFMGSGTTGVASKQNNRNFIGIEMDEHNFEICQNRINNFLI